MPCGKRLRSKGRREVSPSQFLEQDVVDGLAVVPDDVPGVENDLGADDYASWALYAGTTVLDRLAERAKRRLQRCAGTPRKRLSAPLVPLVLYITHAGAAPPSHRNQIAAASRDACRSARKFQHR